MAIRESLLNTITSVASSDFVRLVTSAGESSKATVANLFKSFESGLSVKSSLTANDYVRVVDSDGVPYKQSVGAMLNSVPDSTNGKLKYLSSTSTDFNTITNEWVLAKGTNAPVASTFFYVHTIAYTKDSSGYVSIGKQIAFSYSSTNDETYIRHCISGTWSSWEQIPTRAEVDALNSTLTAIKKTTTAVNLRPNSDVSGTVVIVIPADTYVFTNKVSNAVYHILYMNGSNTYVGYAYTSNFANF